MSLSKDYLTYSQRHYGMDHDRYPWTDLFERKPIKWSNGARVALWITPILQWFPLDSKGKPFRAPGGLTMPFPDFRHYTNRDYGNRVGIFRILKVLQDMGLPASVAMNAAIAKRYPDLLGEIVKQDVEIIAHGQDMDRVHYTGMARDEEDALIREAVATLRSASGQAVKGWFSPGRAQSDNTIDLLAANGVEYSCDWVNDDLPYAMNAAQGVHYSMPMAYETDDRVVMLELHQSEDDWAQQIKDRFDVLYRESEQYGGRVMSIPLHAWVSGVPYRIGKVREVLEYICGHSGVWTATGADILSDFLAGQGEQDA